MHALSLEMHFWNCWGKCDRTEPRVCSMLNNTIDLFLFCSAVFSNSRASAFSRSTLRRQGWVWLHKSRINNNCRPTFVFHAVIHQTWLEHGAALLKQICWNQIMNWFSSLREMPANGNFWKTLNIALCKRAQTMLCTTHRKCVKRSCHRFNRSMISSH